MKQEIIQIPISKQVRARAKKVAVAQGFSSLQEVIRVFLNQFASQGLAIGFTPTIHLSKEADNRYAEMIDELESGKVKVKSVTSVDALETK